MFDHVSVFDLTSLQGDIFLIVREVRDFTLLFFSWLVIETCCESQPRDRTSGDPFQLDCRPIKFEVKESEPVEGHPLGLV